MNWTRIFFALSICLLCPIPLLVLAVLAVEESEWKKFGDRVIAAILVLAALVVTFWFCAGSAAAIEWARSK